MGLLSILGSVASAVSSLGSAAVSFCTKVLPVIGPALEKVAGVANVLLPMLKIFKPNEKVEDVGERSLQAAEQGIKPDKFPTHEEYMNKIRDFKLDPEKAEKRAPLAKMAAGIAVGTIGLEKKFDFASGGLNGVWTLAAKNPEYFGADRLVDLINLAKVQSKDFPPILRYFEGKLEPSEAVNMRDQLIQTEKQKAPDKTDAAIYSEINAARESFKTP
jgi:hypothetical protein